MVFVHEKLVSVAGVSGRDEGVRRIGRRGWCRRCWSEGEDYQGLGLRWSGCGVCGSIGACWGIGSRGDIGGVIRGIEACEVMCDLSECVERVNSSACNERYPEW